MLWALSLESGSSPVRLGTRLALGPQCKDAKLRTCSAAWDTAHLEREASHGHVTGHVHHAARVSRGSGSACCLQSIKMKMQRDKGAPP